MAALRSLLLLVGCALTQAWQGAGLMAHPAAVRSASSAVSMKHNDYYQRVQRSESGRMRLCVYRSNNHIYGQVIDDVKGAVLASASTMEKEVREADGAKGGNCDAASAVGKRLAERAVAKGVSMVYFDRNGKKYHGRVKALADGAREAGLSF